MPISARGLSLSVCLSVCLSFAFCLLSVCLLSILPCCLDRAFVRSFDRSTAWNIHTPIVDATGHRTPSPLHRFLQRLGSLGRLVVLGVIDRGHEATASFEQVSGFCVYDGMGHEMGWDGMRWDGVGWDRMGWDGTQWDCVR